MEATTPASQGGRVLIVANRLPVNVQQTEKGLSFQASAGGLATGLSSLRGQFETRWVGWPGPVHKNNWREVEDRLINELQYHPVFMSERLIQKYYEGYSNRTIWPIFHSFPAYAKFNGSEWEAYRKANQMFSDAVAELYRPGDILWIHDYHMMLLPRYVRDRIPNATMGFFLHIPFPNHDIFRLVPQHKEILESLLSLDLIGFHTNDYVQAFLGSVRRVLGHDNTLGQILVGDRVIHVDSFPMGIDFEKYNTALADPVLQEEIEQIRNHMKTRKRVFSVSRLDYTKGIPESLQAIREFLIRHPQWHTKVGFVLVVVPSREQVDRYASLKREIDEMVGNINSEFGRLNWTPIRYIYRSLSFSELIGLYAAADVALITPLRDGMNLIAKEYLAVRNDERGVLILGELAGAAQELAEALLVNPNSVEHLAEAIHKALQIPEEEQVRRNRLMRARLETHGIRKWVGEFFGRLREVQEVSHMMAVRILDERIRARLLNDYAAAAQRLLILDYDGTLVPFADSPSTASPDPQLIRLLEQLATSPKNRIVILSGRDRHSLESWFSRLPLTLVSEHGGWVRSADSGEWTPTIAPSESEWKKDIRPKMEPFVDRVPGSFIEEKEFSLVWHYRQAESETAFAAAKELNDMLSGFATNMNIHVLPGNKTVEVKTASIGKGMYYSRHLSQDARDFLLAIGDDWTDEELFAALPDSAYSIKVSLKLSKARFNVREVEDVRVLLRTLAKQENPTGVHQGVT
jgi:trehalose 6-phosphate synthase/phosphatase